MLFDMLVICGLMFASGIFLGLGLCERRDHGIS